MVLWILATPDCYRSVALRFNKTPGVLHYHFKKVINALVDLAETYITWPGEEERAILARAVEKKTGFPGVVGAVDGTHIKIQTPVEETRPYFNRKQDHSIVLQAVADINLLIRDIHAGEPGGEHDSRVFRRSPLCTALLEAVHNYLSNNQHILGDKAYVLTDRVLTPFRNYGRLTEEQLNYNDRHAAARVCVECAFALLKNKWRRLKFLAAVDIELAVKTIVACVVLHNFILLEGDGLPLDQREADIMNAEPRKHIHLLVDDDVPVDYAHPNVPLQQDNHPLLENARILGIEQRIHIMGRLPPPHPDN